MKTYIKVVTGFRGDQSFSIEDSEAHKAYYLFLNPEERGIFKSGLALIGKNIQNIEPDYHATMGWNKGHILNSDDYNELKTKGIEVKIRNLLYCAKELAHNRPDLCKLPLEDALTKSGLVIDSPYQSELNVIPK